MPTLKTLAGTSLSASHIGEDASNRLAATIKDVALAPAVPVLTAGAETANAIAVGIQLVDANGKSLTSSRSLLCQAFDPDMEPGIEAAFTLAETGVGAEVSLTAKAGLLITTDANGAAEVTLTDVSAALAATAYLKVAPVDGLGAPAIVACIFA